MRSKLISFSVSCIFLITLLSGCHGFKSKMESTLSEKEKENTLSVLYEDENTKEELSYGLKEPSDETITEHKQDTSDTLEEITILKDDTPQTEKTEPLTPKKPEVTKRTKASQVTLEDADKTSKNLFNIYIRDADLKSLLMGFSQKTKYSIILDPNIQGKVTMDLKEVTIEDALKEILSMHGYNYEIEDNFIRIYKPRQVTKIFRLNYLPTVREGISKVEAKAPGGVDTDSGSPIEIISKETADLWAEVENGIKGIISKTGTYSINKMAAIVTITDLEENLEKIATFLDTIEGSVQKQVVIEATVMEVVLSDDFQLGVDWENVIGRENSSSFAKFGMDSEELFTSSMFRFSFKSPNFETFINTLSKQGKVKIISKPRVTTLNNQKAIIKVGTEEIYFDYEEKTETIDNNDRTRYIVTPNFFTVGLILDVTPQISPLNEITLHIHPLFSEKKEDRTVPTGLYTVPMSFPIVNVRETSSVVKVRSGETVVLAGLMMEKTEDIIAGVPVLKNLPIFGNLFRHTQKTTETTELIVTLTPKILQDQEMKTLGSNELERLFDL